MTPLDGSDSQLRRMLSALERSRLKLEAVERERSEPIAIIGAACRLPGGIVDLESFWAFLERGGDAVSELPEARWNTSNLFDRDRAATGKTYSNAMAQLDGANHFDPAAFGISIREAERMDPQQRQLLEVSYEAIAHAGLNVDDLHGSNTGVFVGICANDFAHRFSMESSDIYTATGNSLSTASGRLSYTFGFHGPAISIDTACSSSLVALHLACQSLRKNETSLALVGGVHVTAGAESSIGLAKLNALSASGRCRTFSADADGYVRGEGCVVVMAKRLSDALRESDVILGLIKETAVNQDGRSNGLTAPNRIAQTALLRSCLSRAKIRPADVGYLEAHGTGTKLGDPIELAAAAAAYGIERTSPLWVGSAKTNIGHLEAAAGLAGVLRALLALRHATIPPNLHLNGLNPHFDWSAERLCVAQVATPFPLNPSASRIAGVSSFGFSGTNAHVLLEQASDLDNDPASLAASACGLKELLIVSADSVLALQEQARRFAGHLSAAPGQWREICYTSRFRRNSRVNRLAVIAGSGPELAMRLGEYGQGIASAHAICAKRLPGKIDVVAVFSGQGTQWAGMGRELYATCGHFATAFDTCAMAIYRHSAYSMRDALTSSESEAANFDAATMQPLLFTIAFALAEHLRKLGLRFSAVVGQSMGEVTAAAVAGVLSLDDAARLICARSRLGSSVTGGTMAMVSMSMSDANALIRAEGFAVTVAASNGPDSTLVSGEVVAVDELVSALQLRGVFCRRLRVDYASHSPFMDSLLQPLKESLTGLGPRRGESVLYSTVTGNRIAGTALNADYWAANLRQPVLFYPAIKQMIDDGYRLFVEIGPRPALAASIDDALKRAGVSGCVACAMRDDEPQVETALLALARLYANGAELQVERQPARVVPIPAHQWQHLELALPNHRNPSVANSQTADILDSPRSIAGQAGAWIAEGRLNSADPIVSHHRVDGSELLPGTGFLQMALQAGRQLWPTKHVSVKDVTFQRVLAFPGEKIETRVLQLALRKRSTGLVDWKLSSREDGRDALWTEHAHGRLLIEDGSDVGTAVSPADLRTKMPNEADGATLYAALQDAGLQYGERFQMVQQIWWFGNEFLARLDTPLSSRRSTSRKETINLDACLHGLAWLGWQQGDAVQIPASLESLTVHDAAATPVWVHGVRTVDPSFGRTSTADLFVYDDAGSLIARLGGLRATSPEGDMTSLPARGEWLYGQTWIDQPLLERAAPADRNWLVVATRRDVSQAALRRLQANLGGAQLLSWQPSNTPTFPTDILRNWVGKSDARECSIVYLGDSVCLTQVDDSAQCPDDAENAVSVSIGALGMVKAVLAAFEGQRVPTLTFVSAGAQAVNELAVPRRAGLGDATLWGLCRALSFEHAELRVRCVDLDPEDGDHQAERLADELNSGSAETEVALRSGRWVGRLARRSLGEERAATTRLAAEPYRVEIDRPGVLDSLTLRAAERSVPIAGQVEIEVAAAALNFADVMRAMGFFVGTDEHSVALGSECAGVVTRVGDSALDALLGQAVVAIGSHCLASHVTVDAALTVPLPARLSAAEIAGLPIASMTAWYALKEVASLKPDQRVLIHSASGGTGLAAVLLALSVGAEVFATAGSESKRQMLRELGVRHVFDSRSGDFERATLDVTRGDGVDVVLNSLAGNAIEKSLRVLAADGWFLELGKRDIYEDGRLSLSHFKRRIRFVAIDLAGLQRERPSQFAALFLRVMREIEEGGIAPLPVTVLPVSQASEAFQRMAAAQHVGKLVLEMNHENLKVAEPIGPAPLLRGTHIITGGAGGLGSALADWLAAHGARRLVLIGRSSPDEMTRNRVAKLRERGVEVRIITADVGVRADLSKALETIEVDFGPVRGIFHLAGVLHDGLIETQTPDHFRRVLMPKIAGAWHLHELTAGYDLDHFVLYSSAAALLPSPSQTSYSAANAFLDALARYRRGQKLPALSVQWGPFADTGLAAAVAERGQRLAARGAASMTAEQSHHYLGALMKRSDAVVGVFPFDCDRWLDSSPAVAAHPRFDLLRIGKAAVRDRGALRARFREAAPDVQRKEMLALLRCHAAAVLRLPESSLTSDTMFTQVGLNSLTGLELRNRIESELGLPLSSAILWRYPTIDSLADHLLECIVNEDMQGTRNRTGDSSLPTISKMTPDAAVPADEIDAQWFLRPRRVVRPRLRLICIPFLGGLASIFSSWATHLPEDVELLALQLPGRAPRHNEAAHSDFAGLVDELQAVLLPKLDVPYVIYGHSLGALLSFGVTQALRDAGARLPKHLFLAAYPAPHLHNPISDIARSPEPHFLEGLKRLRGIPEQVLADQDLLNIILPSLRAEVQLLASYAFVPEKPLNVPTTVLSGTDDHLVTLAEIEAWSSNFSGPFDIVKIRGGHYFVRDAARDVVDALMSRLSP